MSKICVILEWTGCRRTLSKVQETFVTGTPNQHHTVSQPQARDIVWYQGEVASSQPRHHLPETVLELWSFQGRRARQTRGGSSTSPFYTWGFWATDLPRVIWRACAKPGIYYPLPKSQAGAKYSWVVCWMPQSDSWKVLLHSQWNQWVPQFRMHLFLNCTDRQHVLTNVCQCWVLCGFLAPETSSYLTSH